MMPRQREVEMLLLAMFAAVPLYGTRAVGILPLVIYHVVMAGIVWRVWRGKGPELIPSKVMRAIAVGYVFFYIVDAAMISRSAIAASTHLVLFIAAYQPIESVRTNNYAQRLLTAALIFIASIATSTHISIVLFVLAFAYVMFRQMMYVSHLETIRSIGRDYAEPPSGRAAAFYLVGTAIVGAMLFPLLPRIRNPFVQGVAGALTNASTGLSDTINFSEDRTSTPDPAVVARVWMGREAIPFFTPLRLRGAVYDRYWRNEWRQGGGDFREIAPRRGTFRIARPLGFTRGATVQQQMIKNSRLFLPSGTYAVSGVQRLFEGPTRDTYSTYQARRGVAAYDVSMARATEPLRQTAPRLVNYNVTPEVRALANQIVGSETEPDRQAAEIERYLLRNFRYLQRPEEIGKTMSVEDFLLRERRGHCEYFAAGMVVLLTAREVPARIVGGFYGGRLNPLTGYFVVRREDAHAWVEAWDGKKWVTYDPTPAALRPGNTQAGLVSVYATAIGDSITYFWDRYILTFGLSDQIALAAEVMTRVREMATSARANVRGGVREIASGQFVAVAAIVFAAGFAAIFFARRRRPLFDLLAEHLRRVGIEVGPAVTMEEALAHLRATHPDHARELAPLIELYEAERFSTHQGRARELKKRLAELRA